MEPECEVCNYVKNFLPTKGFMAFRDGLDRVGIDALRAACEHRSGLNSTLRLQRRGQLIDRLWENCLGVEPVVIAKTAVKTQTSENQVTQPTKKQKTDNAPTNDVVTVQGNQNLFDDEKTEALVAGLTEEVKRLRGENEKFAETQQQLIENQQQLLHKQAELVEIVQRLLSQHDVSNRLLCIMYDRQRSSGEMQPEQLRFPELHHVEQTLFIQPIQTTEQRSSMAQNAE